MINEPTRRKESIITLLSFGLVALLSGCSREPSDFEKLRKQQQRQEATRATSELDVEAQIDLAKHELELGSSEQAQSIVERLLLKHPERSDVMRLMAEVLYQSGDRLAAADLIASIPYRNSTESSAAKLKAVDWYLQVNAYGPAIELLRSATEASPDHDRLRHRLVDVLNQSGQRIAACRVLQPLIREGKASERDLFSMITRGDVFIDESLPIPDASNLSLASLSVARRLHDEADLHAAKEQLSNLRQRYPESTAIAAFQGRVLADLQDLDSLEKWRANLPSAIREEPEYWYALGTLALQRHHLDSAIRCFGEALLRDPTDRDSLISIARCFQRVMLDEEADEAMRQFELLVRTSELAKIFGSAPGTPDQYREMAAQLDALGRPWESIAWERLAVARTGNHPRDVAALSQKRENLIKNEASTLTSSLDQAIPWSRKELSQWPLPASLQAVDSSSQRNVSPQITTVPAPIRFSNVTSSVSLHFQYDNGDNQDDNKFFLHQQTGGGIGVLDFDRDGWVDLYCSQAGANALEHRSLKPNRLFRHLSPNSVQDVTEVSHTGDRGYGQGITVADINQDGFSDLLVANIGKNVLLLNNGDGTFSRAKLPREGDGKWTTSIACGDLNGDHLPDLIEVNYIDDPTAFEIPCLPNNDACGPNRFQPAADRWMAVDPVGVFRPISSSVDSRPSEGHSFAVLVGNLNGELGNDVYIANDGDANHYWQNRVFSASPNHSDATPHFDSRFASKNQVVWQAEETASLSGIATSQLGGRHGSMGLTIGDFDRNGLPDLHVTNYWDQEADLYLQEEGKTFQNSSRGWKIHERSKATVGWGTQAADFDRDGREDLLVLNGHIVDHRHRGVPFRMLPQLFQGHDDHFQLVSDSAVSGVPERDAFWSQPTLGRTLAVLDWNRDGLPDVVANHLDQPATLLQNESESRSWLQIELIGTRSERDAVGATVEVECGSNRWTSWVTNGGFLTTNEALLDFGLGDSDHPCQITIEWPSGTKQTVPSLASNGRYVITEGETSKPWQRETFSRK